MANRLRGNVYIVDSGSINLDAVDFKVGSFAFWSTDTTGEIVIVSQANTADVLIRIRNNQGQPFTLPLYLGGVNFKDIRCQTLTAGTGFFYLV